MCSALTIAFASVVLLHAFKMSPLVYWNWLFSPRFLKNWCWNWDYFFVMICGELLVTRKFLDWKFLFESSQTKIAWKLIPWPENCWLRKFRDCNFLACKFLDPKIPCTENSLKAPWDENSLTRAKGYNWLPRAATVPERIALKISNI